MVNMLGIGAWRSLVAHWHGGPGVSSSNLLAPTNVRRVIEIFHPVVSPVRHFVTQREEDHGAGGASADPAVQ